VGEAEKKLEQGLLPGENYTEIMGRAKIKMREFQKELSQLGYKYQFITLSGFHQINDAAFRSGREYAFRGTEAYATEIQESEARDEKYGQTAKKHQEHVGSGYVDNINATVDPKSTIASGGEGDTMKQM
jgi:isocitrate lyase